MRTLVSTFLVGACFVAAPALAQQHPWVPSGVYSGNVYTGNVRGGDAPARAYGRFSSGNIVDTAGPHSRKSGADDLYGNSCNSSHAVFACPGSGGQ
jgi:hypothetical protein